MAKKKPGPRPKDIADINGKRYEGLRYYKGKQKIKGKTYIKEYHYYDFLSENGEKKRKYFSPDKNKAVFEFEKFKIESENANQPILEIDTDFIPIIPTNDTSIKKTDNLSKENDFFDEIGLSNEGYIEWSDIPEDAKLFFDTYDDVGARRVGINEDLFWHIVKYQLENYPVKFATKVDKEQIKYLDDLKPTKSLTMNEIRKLYFEERNESLHPKTERDYKNFWNVFRKVVEVNLIRDISFEHIEKYKKYILNQALKLRSKNKGGNAKWVNNRFYFIKTIFNNVYKKKGDQYPDVDRILKHCLIFEKQDEPAPDPKPISLENYKRFIEYWNDDMKYKAILLLALNCGFKTGEVAQIMKADINYEFNSLSMVRKKKKTIRVACLWERTIGAIKEYQKQCPHDSEFLFLNDDGNPMTSQNIRRKWYTARKKMEIPKEIVFDHIRDASETIPASYGFKLDDIKFLMGHRTGIPDRYLRRAYGLVSDICKCIENHFFENQK